MHKSNGRGASPDLHAIEAAPARWRGDVMHPIHWLICAQATIAKQREACAEAVEARGDGHDPEIDPELGIVAARAACVPTFLVGLSPDARYDPRVLDAEKRKRKVEADWSLALMAPQATGPVSQNKARWLKAKANLRRVAADARDDAEAKSNPV